MCLTVFLSFLNPDKTPCVRTYEGIKDFRCIKGTISFKYFDKHVSDFRLTKLDQAVAGFALACSMRKSLY